MPWPFVDCKLSPPVGNAYITIVKVEDGDTFRGLYEKVRVNDEKAARPCSIDRKLLEVNVSKEHLEDEVKNIDPDYPVLACAKDARLITFILSTREDEAVPEEAEAPTANPRALPTRAGWGAAGEHAHLGPHPMPPPPGAYGVWEDGEMGPPPHHLYHHPLEDYPMGYDDFGYDDSGDWYVMDQRDYDDYAPHHEPYHPAMHGPEHPHHHHHHHHHHHSHPPPAAHSHGHPHSHSHAHSHSHHRGERPSQKVPNAAAARKKEPAPPQVIRMLPNVVNGAKAAENGQFSPIIKPMKQKASTSPMATTGADADGASKVSKQAAAAAPPPDLETAAKMAADDDLIKEGGKQASKAKGKAAAKAAAAGEAKAAAASGKATKGGAQKAEKQKEEKKEKVKEAEIEEEDEEERDAEGEAEETEETEAARARKKARRDKKKARAKARKQAKREEAEREKEAHENTEGQETEGAGGEETAKDDKADAPAVATDPAPEGGAEDVPAKEAADEKKTKPAEPTPKKEKKKKEKGEKGDKSAAPKAEPSHKDKKGGASRKDTSARPAAADARPEEKSESPSLTTSDVSSTAQKEARANSNGNGVQKVTAGALPLGADHPKYKTELCTRWTAEGSCNYAGRCNFAHGKEELQELPPDVVAALAARATEYNFKTKLCRDWEAAGSCVRGDTCTFAHGHEELRTPTKPPAAGGNKNSSSNNNNNNNQSGGSNSASASAGAADAGAKAAGGEGTKAAGGTRPKNSTMLSEFLPVGL